MPLQLSLMEEHDIPAFALVDEAGMKDWGYARAMSPPDGRARHQFVEEWTRASFTQDSSSVWLKVVDTDLDDELVAAALWKFELDVKGRKPLEANAAEMSANEVAGAEPKKPDMMATMRRNWMEFQEEFFAEEAYANLQILVTHPQHQRRGAGRMLVEWGCEQADARGIVSVLYASAAGLGLYLSCGFEVVKEFEMDLKPYGVDEVELRRACLRRPRPVAK